MVIPSLDAVKKAISLDGHAQLLGCVWPFGTPWNVIHQASLPMEFSRQEYWSGMPFPTPGDILEPVIKPASPALVGGFFTTSTTWEALFP